MHISKLKCLLFFVAMLMLLCAHAAAESDVMASGTCGTQGDNLVWTLDSTGTLTITGEGEMVDFSSAWSWDNYESSIKAVVIGDGVTKIGSRAFSGCSSLKHVIIPESVTIIEAYSFDRCTSLTEIELHDGITIIDMYAFYHCTALDHIDLPKNCEKIDAYAFEGCAGLERIELPEKLKTVDTQAFAYCTNLMDIVVTGANTRFYAYAFEGCKSIRTLLFTSKEAAGHDRQAFAVYYPIVYCYSGSGAYNWAYAYGYRFVKIDGVRISRLKTYKLPAGVKVIGEEAFLNTGANCIILPDGCESIASRAFANCSRLVSITMPDSVTSIAEDAFEGSARVTFICESRNTAQAYAEAYGIEWTPEP